MLLDIALTDDFLAWLNEHQLPFGWKWDIDIDNHTAVCSRIEFQGEQKHVYITNTFRLCIKAISKSSIHPLFCEKHRKDSLPGLIREYVHIRFFFEQKRYNDFSFSKSNTRCKTKDKKKKSK